MRNSKHSGFTIVELLVVIVVIGVLASISLVSYTGISNQAIVSTLKADLSNGFNQLKLFQVENSGYPADQTALTTCPAVTGTVCFRPSPGNTIASYIVNNATIPQTFVLTLQHGNLIYEVTESVTSYLVTPQPLTSVSISGSTTVGSVLSATSLAPSGATATYQWQSSTASNGTYTNIAGATNSSYTLVAGDLNNYIKVVATGNTVYYPGVVTSSATAQITMPPPITAIAAITGTMSSGQTITAGALTPSGATATYQWQIATTLNGTYTNIGTSGSTYVLTASDIDKFIKVTATGTGGGVVSTTAYTSIDWLLIDTQVWAKANSNNSATGKRCYNDDNNNCIAYGGLYTWDAAMQNVTTNGAQGICPAGSHIPTNTEWNAFNAYVGSGAGSTFRYNGSSGYNLPFAGTFTIGPPSAAYIYFGTYGFYWSSTQVSGTNAYRYYFQSPSYTNNLPDSSPKGGPYSVRCLKN